MLMPEPYDSNHDSFLENYMNTLEPRILNQDRLVVGKHKTGFGNFFNLF
jgi:two-component system, LuxR family, sensor kinase FixL